MQKPYNIETYEDMGEISDERLKSAVDLEEAIFGSLETGYGEYMFCSDSDCRRILSIDEVHGLGDTPEDYLKFLEIQNSKSDSICCPEPNCNGEMIRTFDRDYFDQYLREMYRGAYGALLIGENDTVQGSSILKRVNIGEAFEDEINYREGFDRKKALETTKLSEASEVLLWNRFLVAATLRKSGAFNDMAKANFNMHPENDELPGMAATMESSRTLPIFLSTGLVNIVDKDEFGSVMLHTPRMGDIRNFLNMSYEEKMALFGSKKQKLKTTQQEKFTAIQGRKKYYKGVALFDELQAAAEAKKARGTQ